MLRVCACETPAPSPNPRTQRRCNRCSGAIESLTTDAVVADWFDRLGEALFRHDKLTGELATSKAFDAFRDHCERREKAGRDHFGNRFMSRDSIEEALEEFCDGALYLMLDSLRHELEEGVDGDIDLGLTVAFHAFKSYESCLMLREKRHHHTGPGWDE